MKLPARCVVWLLPLLLAGCFHKAKPAQVQTLAPPTENAPATVPGPTEPPPPAATVPSQPPAPGANAQTKETPKPPVRRRKRPTNNTPQASRGNSGVSAVGQLSSGGAFDLRQQTLNSIAATERGLNGLGHQLNAPEQKTAAQVREFLKQARTALNSGDVDGARTLAAKAGVLLGELDR
jgi:outer membrane biosynthesis protein TonB